MRAKPLAAFRAVAGHLRLGPMTPGARRGLLYLVLLYVGISVASFTLSARAINATRHELHALCASSRDIGNLAHGKLTVDPKTGRPSKIAVSFIGDERAAFTGLGCAGRLEAPSAQFSRWAAVYHVPVR